MISIMEEPAISCTGELCQLYYEHGKEVIGDKFNLNFITIADAIKSGLTRFFIARTDDGTPIGYAYYNIYRDLMRASDIVADCQAIYVKPEYRGRTAIKLIKTAELCLKSTGIKRIYMRVPKIEQTTMLKKLGYSTTEFVVEKEL